MRVLATVLIALAVALFVHTFLQVRSFRDRLEAVEARVERVDFERAMNWKNHEEGWHGPTGKVK